MTKHEDHLKRADIIASEALGIALEKERTAHQETKKKFEDYKAQMKLIFEMIGKMDLEPKKEESVNRFKKGE